MWGARPAFVVSRSRFLPPSSETVAYDSPKLGGLQRGRMKLKLKTKKKTRLADRLTTMRTSGAFGKKAC